MDDARLSRRRFLRLAGAAGAAAFLARGRPDAEARPSRPTIAPCATSALRRARVRRLYRHVAIADGRSARRRLDQSILVADGRIAWIRPSGRRGGPRPRRRA